jgi:HIRAN domain
MDPRRLRRIVFALAAIVLGPPAQAQQRGPVVRMLVQSSPLAGYRYHAAAELWEQLKVGDFLELSREPDNPHDPSAVSVSWRGRKLGYVPRRENAAVARALDRGMPLRARISKLAEDANPSRRLQFEVFME